MYIDDYIHKHEMEETVQAPNNLEAETETHQKRGVLTYLAAPVKKVTRYAVMLFALLGFTAGASQADSTNVNVGAGKEGSTNITLPHGGNVGHYTDEKGGGTIVRPYGGKIAIGPNGETIVIPKYQEQPKGGEEPETAAEYIKEAGKELGAGHLKKAESMYKSLLDQFASNKIQLTKEQIDLVKIGLHNIKGYKEQYPHLYK